MIISSKYDLGDKVKVRTYPYKAVKTVFDGEIKRISVHPTADGPAIRYTIKYIYEGEWLETDRWEDDLVKEDLTLSAMPQLLQIQV